MQEQSQLIIIQPTPFCNIDCKYCYLPNRMSKQKISMQTLDLIFLRIFEEDLISEGATILWHAGEPLVLPIEFYRQAYQIVHNHNKNKVSISHNIQTNATLLTEQWCKFIKETSTHVGVSLDGPKHIHDHSRKDRSGKGTFDKVMKGIHLLQSHQINFSVITVLTDYSLDHHQEIFDFLVENNIMSWAFNVEELEGANTQSTVTANSAGKYATFMKNLLRFIEVNNYPISVRELDFIEGCIHNYDEPLISSESTPLNILSFDCNGNFSTFSPELLTTTHENYGDFFFGNVYYGAIRDMFRNDKFQIVFEEIKQGRTNCHSACQYYDVCGGGTPANKLSENGSFNSTETDYCRLRVKVATDIVIEHLEKRYRIK